MSQQSQESEGWEDVTAVLDAAQGAIGAGELLHEADFTIRGVMSASEALDARMDAGAGCCGVLTAEERISAGILAPPDATLCARHAAGAMDDLLRAFAAWADGRASAAHTLLCCEYAQLPPDRLTSPLLGPVVAGLLTAAAFAREVVAGADIAASEDFAPFDCALLAGGRGLSAAAWCAVPETAAALEDADALLTAVVAGKVSDAPELVGCEGPADAVALAAKLAAHVRMCKALLGLHNALLSWNVAAARKCVAEGLAQIEPLRACAGLGERPPASFDPLAWKRVRTVVAVRDVDFPDTLGAIDVVHRHFADMADALAVCDLPLVEYISIYLFMQRYCCQPRCPIARSWLQYIVLTPEKAFGKKTSEIAATSLIAFPIPERLVRNAASEQFVTRLGDTWPVVLSWIGRTPARQQRAVTKCLSHLEAAQAYALQADRELIKQYAAGNIRASSRPQTARAGHYFTMYVVFVKLLVMTRYLQLGFELDLYSRNELHSMFWYVDYLLSVQLSQYQEMAGYAADFESRFAAFKKKAGKKRKDATPASVNKLHERFQKMLVAFITAEAQTARGSFRFHTALLSSGLEKLKEDFPYGTPEMRFDRRVQPFSNLILPNPLSYAQYKEHANYSQITLPSLIVGAVESYVAAKDAFAQFQQTISDGFDFCVTPERAKGWLRAIITSIVGLQHLKTAGQNASTTFAPAQLDFSFHPHHPAISLVPASKRT